MSTQLPIDIHAVQTTWQAFDATAQLHPVRNEGDYDRMVSFMNSLLEVIKDDEDHPLAGLLDVVGELVSTYEREHYAIEAVEPRAALQFLMEARGLKQEDLSDILPQSNLSAILSGKRKISATLAGKLGRHFGISPAVFIPS